MDTQLTDRQVERRRKRRRGIGALLGAVSILTIGAGSMSLAQFTDSATSTWAFATGTIDVNTSPAVLTAISNMLPGDTATQVLTVTNAGSGDLRYAMSVAATTLNGAGFGSSAQGAQAGDRNIAAGSSEVLCLRVSLPLSTGNALQAA